MSNSDKPKSTPPHKPEPEDDLTPLEKGFLRQLDAHMAAHPELLKPVDAEWFARVERLVKGVKP